MLATFRHEKIATRLSEIYKITTEDINKNTKIKKKFPDQINTKCQIQKLLLASFYSHPFHYFIKTDKLISTNFPSSLSKNIIEITVTPNVSSSPQWY